MNPEIPIPDWSDPLAWVIISEIHAAWVREIAPQYGIDVPIFILGDVLDSIIGDDRNCFGLTGLPFNPDHAELLKKQLLIRLRWEIATPETPEPIRERLTEFLTEAESGDWENEQSFNEIKTDWTEKVNGFVQREVASNSSYGEAIAYQRRSDAILSPEYQRFLYGRTIAEFSMI